jgi:LmbE family N-acetylglucosaminyl deacetylase
MRKHISKAILRFVYRAICTKETRATLTSLSLQRLLFLVRDINPPREQITDFSAPRVLVLAPHMDDEVLGCGGTLRRHVLTGAEVTAVYMTDGCKGNPDLYHSGLPQAVITEKELALSATRKDESARAAKILGIQELIFLDNPEAQLAPSAETVEQVRNILQERQPQVVYLPSILDLHADHWATNCILYMATKGLHFASDWRPVYRGYEIWTPLLASRMVDISEVIKIKEQAIEQFASQLAHADFLRTILGLNAYRSLYHARGHGYAEAFYESTPEGYCQIFERLSQGERPVGGGPTL